MKVNKWITGDFSAGSCILIVCAAILQSGIGLPSFYNFSITNKQNEAGRKLIEIHLNHEDGKIWDLEIDQSAGGTAAKIIPLNNEEVKCKLEKVDNDSNGLSGDVRESGLGIYKIHNERKNWTMAKEVCELDGSHLMIINSEREVQSLDNLIEKNNNINQFWIGIHDQYVEGDSAEKSTRQTLLTQPTSSNLSSNFYVDLTRTFVAANIPWNAIENPVLRQKYCKQNIPSESTLRKNYLDRIHLVGDSYSVDETSDSINRYIANMVVGKLSPDGPSIPHLVCVNELSKVNSHCLFYK
ncbi:hypothetical protein C0J52_14727 [Blattella germanica]|nr:hypothetical protein C0J52_14727 [Blattella germanica]